MCLWAELTRLIVQRYLDVCDVSKGDEGGVQHLLVHLLRQPSCGTQHRVREGGGVMAKVWDVLNRRSCNSQRFSCFMLAQNKAALSKVTP